MAAALAGCIVLGQLALGSGLVTHQHEVHWEPALLGHVNASLLSHRVWDSTVSWVNHEVHEIEMEFSTHKNVNKVTYVFLAMLFPCCGFDRCFMGQLLCGCLKFSTCGGFIVWAVLDYFFAFYLAVTMGSSVNNFGYQAEFDPTTIDGAFWVGLILFVLNAVQQMLSARNSVEQLKRQNELLETMENNSKGGAAKVSWMQQSMVLAPTFASRTLRKAGALSEQVTLPEVIGLFESLDKNGDGELSHQELREGLSALGTSEEQINTIMAVADSNEDGSIDRMEFLTAFGVQLQQTTTPRESNV